jgi:serine/threonine protein phosphatase PrpC
VDAATFALERMNSLQVEQPAPAGNVEHPRVAALRRSILEADAAWRENCRADEALAGTGATLAALSLADVQAVVAHLGDCRGIQLRGWRVIRETADHVPEATARPSGVAVRAIVRAFGMGANPEVDVWGVEPGDVFALLAGVHDFLSPAEMVSMLRDQASFAAAAAELISSARERGAVDYCGIVLARAPAAEGAT